MRPHRGVATILGPRARGSFTSALGELWAEVRSLSVLGGDLRSGHLTAPQVEGRP